MDPRWLPLPSWVFFVRLCSVVEAEHYRATAVGLAFGDPLMPLGTILLVILILLLIGAVPSWPHSRGWGYGPSGILGVVLVIVVIMLLMGRL